MDLEFADREHFTVGLSDRERSVDRQVDPSRLSWRSDLSSTGVRDRGRADSALRR